MVQLFLKTLKASRCKKVRISLCRSTGLGLLELMFPFSTRWIGDLTHRADQVAGLDTGAWLGEQRLPRCGGYVCQTLAGTWHINVTSSLEISILDGPSCSFHIHSQSRDWYFQTGEVTVQYLTVAVGVTPPTLSVGSGDFTTLPSSSSLNRHSVTSYKVRSFW